jgi:electron transport complex protein RnfC
MGGPMMGVDLPSASVGVTKATNCIIAASIALFPPPLPALPCIRCTRCADVCPAELQPQDLFWFAKANNFGKAQNFHLFDCIECGACAYVCPSHIPLVQYYRYAKNEISAREQESRAAEIARERHEYRQFRIEREKLEKAAKLAQKEKAALAAKAAEPSSTLNPDEEDARIQMRIEAALARAKAQAAANNPKNTDGLTEQQRADIAEIDARRAKAHEIAATSATDNAPPKQN